MENELKKIKNRKKVALTNDWVKIFPSKAGVYAAFERGNIVYVGETGNIRGRMRDLRDSRHHSLRRNIGKNNFSGERGYKDANTKEEFPKHIEKKVDDWLTKKIKISALPTKLGRKELEEKFIEKYDLKCKYNKKGRRTGS